ncbi:MAG: hypothetical protein ACKVU0_01140 [Saprospiraceae bacterium]
MLGNILIVLTLLFYGFLANLLLKPTPGGDYGVGHAFAWMIYVAGFVISTGLLAWNMNLNHCFDWTPASFLVSRNWLVFLGWITFVMAIIWSLDYHSKWIEGEFPQFMRWFARSKVYFWLPALIFIPALYLLNAQRQAGFAPFWIKIPLLTCFVVSLLIGLGIFYGFVKASVQQRITQYQSAQKEDSSESWSFNKSMEEINNYSEKTIQGLLIYTHREQDKRIRDAAVVKIKSYENWEAELINILEQGDLNAVYWVYAYLDGNDIEHPEDFIQPVKHSLERFVPVLQASLKDPNSLHMGYINVEALCRVLDTHFKDSAAIIQPDLVKLQKALDINPPARSDNGNKKWFDETLNASRIAVKNWLESNK